MIQDSIVYLGRFDDQNSSSDPFLIHHPDVVHIHLVSSRYRDERAAKLMPCSHTDHDDHDDHEDLDLIVYLKLTGIRVSIWVGVGKALRSYS